MNEMNQKYHAPLIEGGFYHLFNRANSQTDKLFYQERNYRYFLKKWAEYLHSALEVWSYCLIPNHYHFLVRVKADASATAVESQRCFSLAYTQAVNRQEQRRGSLFQEHPKRLYVESDKHLLSLVRYIHRNPVHHGLVTDLAAWRYSSYRALIGTAPTLVERKKVLDLFGGLNAFLDFHRQAADEREISYCL
ncbi:MAG: hypothetical protein GY862_36485, partial [Gammaproteobacteria bacterium]|nr:hypothetical protein [Gammaproteobacteria bacterium]